MEIGEAGEERWDRKAKEEKVEGGREDHTKKKLAGTQKTDCRKGLRNRTKGQEDFKTRKIQNIEYFEVIFIQFSDY